MPLRKYRNKTNIKFAVGLLVGLLAAIAPIRGALCRGVSPYLPLNMAPEIERDIERVLILGDVPAMRRPIPAAIVLDALPKACAIDEELCRRVNNYLRRYMADFGFTQLQVGGALVNGSSKSVLPNQHGMTADSSWSAIGSAYYQFNDYILANAGLVAY